MHLNKETHLELSSLPIFQMSLADATVDAQALGSSPSPSALSAAALKVISEARKKFNTCMENEVSRI